MIRLSFIVPIFGVEKYIEECIRSLYAQDIPQEEYEVICVDDCSPDNSVAVIEDWKLKVENLKLIRHAENKRQGGARNTGMKVAQGRYIWFVDSDDYIKPNCLKGLLEQAENEDLDILDFDFDADFTKQHFQKNIDYYEMGPCSGADYVFNNYKGKWSWRCSTVCSGLIKRELISDMCFREDVQYEDNDYALKMYARAKRVHHIPERPYYYRVVGDSTVHKAVTFTLVDYNIQLLHAYLGMMDEMCAIDSRWEGGVKELIKYVSHQVLSQLREVTLEERMMFYKQRMGHVPELKKYVGKKTWLAMNYNLLRRVLV